MPSDNYTPSIILPGIGQSKVELVDESGKKIKMAWPLDVNTEELKNELKFSLLKTILLRHDLGFTNKLYNALYKAVDAISTNSDGTMHNNVRVVRYPYSLAKCTEDEKRYIYKMVPLQRLAEVIGENNLYFFSYNSFGEPYETAAELDKFIAHVKQETGSQRVNLVPVSMGGALSTAYFDAYGYKNDIKRVMYFVAALEGSQLIADILNKNIRAEHGLSFVKMLLNNKTAAELQKLVSILPSAMPKKILYTAIDAITSAVLKNSPSIWSIIPPSEYKELRNKYINDDEHSILRAKTDRFYNAQSRVREIIAEREKNGTLFFAAVGYGLGLMELSASTKLSSDTIINSSSTSLGAHFAEPGKKLNKSDLTPVCTNKEHNHLSPDGEADASFGFLPERTWYFYKQVHDNIAYNDTALNIAKKVLSDECFTDVFCDYAFPQFASAHDNRIKI